MVVDAANQIVFKHWGGYIIPVNDFMTGMYMNCYRNFSCGP